MAFGRRQLVVLLLLFFLVVSSTAVPLSRSLKTVMNPVSFGNFDSQVVKEMGKEELELERRMMIQLADYPGTGANRNHDPRTPGRA